MSNVCFTCGDPLIKDDNWSPSKYKLNYRCCRTCNAVKQRAYRERHPDRVLASRAAWVAANPDHVPNLDPVKLAATRARAKACPMKRAQKKATDAAWRAANPERCRLNNAAWAKANPESTRESHRKYIEANRELYRKAHRKYSAANPDKIAAKCGARRARLLGQLPPDADWDAIKAIYRDAKTLTKITGVKYHVDHIVPIVKGGLHHQDNLIVMRWDYNLKKGTKLWPWLNWFKTPSA